MTARLALPTLAAALLATPACAADKLYRIESADFQAYSGAVLPTTVIAPDGSTVHPLQAPSGKLGNFGPLGFNRNKITTGLYVQPNQLVEWGGFYEWLGGDNNARPCVDKIPLGAASHSCIYFNGQTGEISSPADQDIVRYSIVQIVDRPHWFYVSMTFRTAVTIPPDTQSFVYVQTRPGQTLALWKWKLITGQAP